MVQVVDPDTGEITELGEGEEAVRGLAEQAMQASEQKKLWESRDRWLRGELKERQEEKSAVYGNVKVVKTANPPRFDKDSFRARIEDSGLETDDLWELVLAAQGFDRGELNEKLAALVDRSMIQAGSHVRVSRVRKMLDG